jgi:hypothetical protein
VLVLQDPLKQVLTAHWPQLTDLPQLLVTVPHFGLAVPTPHVLSSLSGVQQTSGFGRVSQTWPRSQQAPPQQVVEQSEFGLAPVTGV